MRGGFLQSIGDGGRRLERGKGYACVGKDVGKGELYKVSNKKNF